MISWQFDTTAAGEIAPDMNVVFFLRTARVSPRGRPCKIEIKRARLRSGAPAQPSFISEIGRDWSAINFLSNNEEWRGR